MTRKPTRFTRKLQAVLLTREQERVRRERRRVLAVALLLLLAGLVAAGVALTK